MLVSVDRIILVELLSDCFSASEPEPHETKHPFLLVFFITFKTYYYYYCCYCYCYYYYIIIIIIVIIIIVIIVIIIIIYLFIIYYYDYFLKQTGLVLPTILNIKN